MLRITAFSANAADYLLKGVGCEHQNAPEQGHEQGSPTPGEPGGAGYFLAANEHGEKPGVWHGAGLHMLGVEAGSEATPEQVQAALGRLEHPETGESLGRRPAQYARIEDLTAAALAKEPEASDERWREIEREARQSVRKGVAFYDFTFSPSKSVSVYYSALLESGDAEGAAAVLRAHEDAVHTALDHAAEYAWVRMGKHGRREDGHTTGKWEHAGELSTALFGHSTNRNGEPQIHTHAAVLNRVVSPDGKIRALDGARWRPVKEALATSYERTLEENLSRDMGVEWVTREDGKAREIAGVDAELMREASSRRAEVVARAAEMREAYIEKIGHEPDERAMARINREAALETRDIKRENMQGPGAVLNWAKTRSERLAGVLHDTVAAAQRIARKGHPEAELLAGDRAQVIARGLDEVQARYATFTRGHVHAAIDKQVHEVPKTAVDEHGEPLTRRAYVEGLVDEAVAPGNAHGLLTISVHDAAEVPAELRRTKDGKPLWRAPDDERFVTTAHLEAEERIVAEAAQTGAPAIQGPELEMLRVELSASTLAPAQQQAVAGVVGSGRAADILIGPAGAGKSFTMSRLAEVWREQVGGRVLGLAPSQRAADVLAEDGIPDAMNTARFLAARDAGRSAGQLQAGDLVIVDEVGMASTADLDAISTAARQSGAKVLYAGDSQQLKAVGSGGVLEVLAKDHPVFELDEVKRFNAEWEGPASLRLRDRDPGVLDEYARRGRIHGGTVEELSTQATRGYVAERLEGRQGLVIVDTNEQATSLAEEIQAELVERGYVRGPDLTTLRDESKVYEGDVVQFRQTATTRAFPELQVIDADGVVADRATVANREMGTVRGVDEQGRLLVENDRGTITLPAEYVSDHVTLGYATTVHGAQGATVTGRTSQIVTENTPASALYVGLTRSKLANDALVVSRREADGHDHLEHQAREPEHILRDILTAPDDRDQAATLAIRQADDISGGLFYLGEQWRISLEDQWQARVEAALTRQLGDEQMAKLKDEDAYGALLSELRDADARGHDTEPLIADMFSRTIKHADGIPDSWGAALHWRARQYQDARDPERQVDPHDWSTLTSMPPGVVGEYAREVADVALDRIEQIGRDAVEQQPEWATSTLGDLPEWEPDRVEWEDRAAAIGAYREHAQYDGAGLGPAPKKSDVLGRALYRAAHEAAGTSAAPLEIATATAPELRTKVRDYERAKALAPSEVSAELGQARRLAAGYGRDIVLARQDVEIHPAGTDEHARAVEHLTRSETMAEAMTERARLLAEIDAARRAWDQRIEPTRAAAAAAREELTARRESVTVEEMTEQPALFDLPDDTPRQAPADEADKRTPSRDQFADLRPADDAVEAAHETSQQGEKFLEHAVPDHAPTQDEALFELDQDQAITHAAHAGPVRENQPPVEHTTPSSDAAVVEPAAPGPASAPPPPAPTVGDMVGHALRVVSAATGRVEAATLASEAEHARRAEKAGVEADLHGRDDRDRVAAELNAWNTAREAQREQTRQRTPQRTPAPNLSHQRRYEPPAPTHEHGGPELGM